MFNFLRGRACWAAPLRYYLWPPLASRMAVGIPTHPPVCTRGTRHADGGKTHTTNPGVFSKRRFLVQERDIEELQKGLRAAEAEVSQLARLPVSQKVPPG
jgi:hypothetical protein